MNMKYELNKTYRLTCQAEDLYLNNQSTNFNKHIAEEIGTRPWKVLKLSCCDEVEKIKMLDTGKELCAKDIPDDQGYFIYISNVLFVKRELLSGLVIEYNNSKVMIVKISDGNKVPLYNGNSYMFTKEEAKHLIRKFVENDVSNTEYQIWKFDSDVKISTTTKVEF